ncbi:EAL domain-containing protein [Salmonella enterica subsp. enterica serovar Urbana]|nr:EAL domain-containing protein [Salmonella enterica subsp. enterica serovar Urbana]
MLLTCRIEPIINIRTGVRFGGEILCKPEGKDPERFFRHAPQEIIKNIFQKQIFMFRSNYHEHDRVLFLNATIPLLMNLVWLKAILSCLPGLKVIEIDCQKNRIYFPQLVSKLNEIQKLMRVFNAQLWLDDVYVRDIPLISRLPFRFDGIKIDKHEFWRIYAEQDSQAMINLVNKVGCLTDAVLVEGIENEYQLRYISESNVRYAQGFLWPVDEQESFVIKI